MMYITGDTHGDVRRFGMNIFQEQKQMKKSDIVFIAGDFGGVWSGNPEDKSEKYWNKWLDEKPFITAFVCGNHENFDRLSRYPVEIWHGGKIHKISESIIHLMRGQVYTIDGLKIFTFGGAESHDILDGILEPDDPNFALKKKHMRGAKKEFRIHHVNWWKEELPSEEEMEEGICNLEKHNWKVDIIITHCAPTSIQQVIKEDYPVNKLTEYLQMIHEKCQYRQWYCGHYHVNMNVNEKDKVLYEQMVRIN